MKTLCFVLLFLTSGVSLSSEISIGSVSLEIPEPEGFSLVTPEAAPLYEATKQFVFDMNEEYAVFIPSKDIPAALNGLIPNLPRRFTVQTAKSLIDLSVTHDDFEGMKDQVKAQNKELRRVLNATIAEAIEKANEGFREQTNIDPALSVSQLEPMPAHQDTERSFAYSMLISGGATDANGNPSTFVVAGTLTLLHIKSKVLLLYAYAEESEIEWTRKRSEEWAKAILRANPNDIKSDIKEALPSTISNFNWTKIWQSALAGGVLGGLAVVLMMIVGRLRKRP